MPAGTPVREREVKVPREGLFGFRGGELSLRACDGVGKTDPGRGPCGDITNV